MPIEVRGGGGSGLEAVAVKRMDNFGGEEEVVYEYSGAKFAWPGRGCCVRMEGTHTGNIISTGCQCAHLSRHS